MSTRTAIVIVAAAIAALTIVAIVALTGDSESASSCAHNCAAATIRG